MLVCFWNAENKLVFDEAAKLMEQIREYIDCHYMEILLRRRWETRLVSVRAI